MTQEALGGMPAVPRPVTRIWDRYLSAHVINHAAWLRAHAEGGLVGDCACGGKLKPEPPETNSHRIDYRATCSSCRTDVVCPGGRTLRGRR